MSQYTLLVKELKPWSIYRDALSGVRMLFIEAMSVDDNGWGTAWYYNPVTGRHEKCTVVDNQLQPLAYTWPND